MSPRAICTSGLSKMNVDQWNVQSNGNTRVDRESAKPLQINPKMDMPKKLSARAK